MDPFGDAFGAPATGDAGQDFLNQQANEVAALENQFGVGEVQDNGVSDFFAAPAEPTAITKSHDSDIDIMAEEEMPPAIPTSFADPNSIDLSNSTPNNNEPVALAAPIQAVNYDIQEEAASITKWKKEFATRIQELDEKELKQMSEWEEKAKKDLEEWRRRRQEALEKQRQVNLENEQSFIDERESRSKEGGGDIDWTKVSNLCDFNMKSTKKAKDTSRMKSMFLQMKGDAVKKNESAF